MRTFKHPYDAWGKCQRCGASVPPAGARIGFFGKQDIFPRWCRKCVVAHGDETLLAAWDEAVNAEAARRAAYSKQERR